MVRIHLSILLALLCFLGIHAQKLNVVEFVAKSYDISARTRPRKDVNGNDCALVKVRLAAENASFNGNVVGDVAYDKSEYLVYMAQGSKRITIKLDGFLPLDVSFHDYDIKSLESKTVYQLTITKESLAPQQKNSIIEDILFDGLTADDVYRMLVNYKQTNKERL